MKADSISPPQKSIFTPFKSLLVCPVCLVTEKLKKTKKLLKADWQMFSKLCNIYEKCWFEEGEKKKIYEALPKCQCGFQVTSMVQCRFMFNNLQVLAALDLGWGWQEGGWGACGELGGWLFHTHICSLRHAHTRTRTHIFCSQLIFAVRVYTDASICTAALRLEKQSYLCTHVSNGFMWPPAMPIWLHSLSGVSRDKWKS